MDDPIEQPLYFPQTMLDDIAREARRLDRSLSWCVQKAWSLARDELIALAPASDHPRAHALFRERYSYQDLKRKQTLFFPAEMLSEVKNAAERQDRSLSWLLHQAWCLSIDQISNLPPAPLCPT